MAWIKTIPWSAANKQLRDAIKKQKKLYPTEYGIPDHALDQINESIVNFLWVFFFKGPVHCTSFKFCS